MSESRKCDDENNEEASSAQFRLIKHHTAHDNSTTKNDDHGSSSKQSVKLLDDNSKTEPLNESSSRSSNHPEIEIGTICDIESRSTRIDVDEEKYGESYTTHRELIREISHEASCSKMTLSSPIEDEEHVENREESLLFTNYCDQTCSPSAVHSHQPSDCGDRLRPEPFSIENSCLDLGAYSTEGSIAGTPIEKVYPKDYFSSSNIADQLRRRFKERSASVEILENESNGDNSYADNAIQSSEVASPHDCTASASCDNVFNLDNVELEGIPLSFVQSNKLIKRSPLDSATSSTPRFSIGSDSVLVDLQECHSSNPLQVSDSSTRTTQNQSVEETKQLGTLRVIEVLRVRIRCVRGVRVNRPIYVLAKLDTREIHYSGALHFHDSPSYLDEFSFEGSVPFKNLHIVILEGVTEKPPRPLGRATLRRADIVNHSGRELSLPLRVVGNYREATGQICIDIRRQGATFAIRVVDHCGLNLKEPCQLYLLVSRHPSKEAKKLRICSNGHSSEWLEMSCDEKGTLALRMSLWQELLRGLSSTFHGQIRVDVAERWTSGPSKWFYLRPRHSDGFDEAKMDTNKQPLGDLKVWVSYTADHVLPIENYSYLMTSLATSSTAGPFSASLACLLEHLPKVDLGQVARPIMHALIRTGQLRPLLKALYAADIERCQDLNTLFRSHTLSSKMLHELLKLYGRSYLLITLKPIIDKIYKERRCCEVDPHRKSQGESNEKNMRALLCYFSLVFACITESTSRCPSSIRAILSDLRMVVREKTGRPDVELLAISSFLIMRFFAAAVLSPKSFGIKHEQPTEELTTLPTDIEEYSSYDEFINNIVKAFDFPLMMYVANSRLMFNTLRKASKVELVSEPLISFHCANNKNANSLKNRMATLLNLMPSNEPRVARTLVLLSKMLQRVANCCVSSHPLSSKEQWLSLILEKIADTAHRQKMKNFFDGVSLQTTDSMPQEVSTEIIKEGCLIECRPGSRSSWRPLMLQKRRCVLLTDSELIWHKSHDHVTPKGSLSLSDIRVISSDQRNSLLIKSDSRQIIFQATESSDAADWFSAIERQRNKLRRKTTHNDLHDLYEGDVEREMESLHVLLMEHMETLSNWKIHLDTNEPLPEHCPVMPKSLDGSLLEGADRSTHCSSLSKTIAATIAATRDLEKRHEECVAVYAKQVTKNDGQGTRENAIDDDKYPPLKRSHHRE